MTKYPRATTMFQWLFNVYPTRKWPKWNIKTWKIEFFDVFGFLFSNIFPTIFHSQPIKWLQNRSTSKILGIFGICTLLVIYWNQNNTNKLSYMSIVTKNFKIILSDLVKNCYNFSLSAYQIAFIWICNKKLGSFGIHTLQTIYYRQKNLKKLKNITIVTKYIKMFFFLFGQ